MTAPQRRALVVLGLLIILLGLPWALRGYAQWWDLSMGWKNCTTVEIVLPRAAK